MSDKVLLRVRLAATQKTYEFMVPLSMNVSVATQLIEKLLAERESPLFRAAQEARLMHAEGEHAGRMLDSSACLGDLMRGSLVVDGSLLALV